MKKDSLVKFGVEGVMGYFRPSSCYNRGKVQEFKDRKYFKLSKALERIEKGNLKENV